MHRLTKIPRLIFLTLRTLVDCVVVKDSRTLRAHAGFRCRLVMAWKRTSAVNIILPQPLFHDFRPRNLETVLKRLLDRFPELHVVGGNLGREVPLSDADESELDHELAKLGAHSSLDVGGLGAPNETVLVES